MEVVVYGRSNPHCQYCENLKELLKNRNVSYDYKDITEEDYFEEFMSLRLRTVPAVFIDGVFSGGFTESKELFKEIK